MNDLYYFNPWHDLALANGNRNYQAPVAARIMESDLSLLPLWYAGEGDTVWRDSAHPVPEEWVEANRSLLPASTGWKTSGCCRKGSYNALIPWGWNKVLLKKILTSGIAVGRLPDERMLEKVREISHRTFSAAFYRELRKWAAGFSGRFCGAPEELTTCRETFAFVEGHPKAVLKEPWSGSGRGLCWCSGEMTLPVQQWVRQALHRQGMLIGEPAYEKVLDFAMEFDWAGDGRIGFCGYSLFFTDDWGTYRGNLLATDEEIENRLSAYIPRALLYALRERIVLLLHDVPYRGPVGVDMMVCRGTGDVSHCVHPCVEINFRQTMGLVARRFYDRFVVEGRTGFFYVDYSREAGKLMKDHVKRKALLPGACRSARIENGYYSLTPVTSDTHYRVRVETGDCSDSGKSCFQGFLSG